MGLEGEPPLHLPESQERPRRGDLLFLSHPTAPDTFSGYGLVSQEGRRDHLVGLLMVDRPQPVDPGWLATLEEIYGGYQLLPMTATGEQGILCQMRVARGGLHHLRPSLDSKAREVEAALQPLLDQPPKPILKVHWNPELALWQSDFWIGLPKDMQAVFERTGHGCFAVEREDMVAFITHAQGSDIESFRSAQVLFRWELVEMPTAPLIRFRAAILDEPSTPYVFEHFLNIADPEQSRALVRLIGQEALSFDFFDEEYEYRYSKYLEHPVLMRRELHQLAEQAWGYWGSLSPQRRDFDRAKAEFQRRFPP